MAFTPHASSDVKCLSLSWHQILCCEVVLFGAALGGAMLHVTTAAISDANVRAAAPATPVASAASTPAAPAVDAGSAPTIAFAASNPEIAVATDAGSAGTTAPRPSLFAEPAAALAPLSPNIQWGCVEVLHQIGRGAFGSVFAVRYFGTLASVKLVHKGKASSRDLQSEAELMKTLRHPHVCTIFGVVSDGLERHGLLMELMARSLEQLLRDPHESLCWVSPLLRIALQVAQAMSYLVRFVSGSKPLARLPPLARACHPSSGYRHVPPDLPTHLVSPLLLISPFISHAVACFRVPAARVQRRAWRPEACKRHAWAGASPSRQARRFRRIAADTAESRWHGARAQPFGACGRLGLWWASRAHGTTDTALQPSAAHAVAPWSGTRRHHPRMASGARNGWRTLANLADALASYSSQNARPLPSLLL